MQIYQKAKKLIQQRYKISVRWIPGHSKIERTETAYKATKEAAIGERVKTAKWPSLTNIKWEIIKEKKLQAGIWHEQKKRSKKEVEEAIISPAFKQKYICCLTKPESSTHQVSTN